MGKNRPIYLNGLNGIRAIAVVAIMIHHINQKLYYFDIKTISLFGWDKNHLQIGWTLGTHSVTMFFVLSGFLITYLLTLEKEKTQTINIRKFYVRRILRIWPLYFFYLILAVISAYLIDSIVPDWGNLTLYFLLLANIPFIFNHALVNCDHLWTVAVEEQFYLFWPFFFRKKNINIKKWIIIFILLFMAVRFALLMYDQYSWVTFLSITNRFDCMMFGGLIAILYIERNKIINLITSFPIQLGCWLVLGFHFLNYELLYSVISMEVVMAATAFIIVGQISGKNRIINLENKVCNFLGTYSYGIYIFHPFIIYLLAKTGILNSIDNEVIRAIFAFLIVPTISIFAAYISYEYFEKRFIMLKDKFSVVKSTNQSTS